MAYVVARPRGRFEIRESFHTPKGPRARTLANFEQLTNKVIATAQQRASRPFDPDAVRASARKAVKTADARRAAQVASGVAATSPPAQMRRFVESSRRMAASLESRPPPAGSALDPGDALIDLLYLTAQIPVFKGPRRPEPRQFPSLALLRAQRTAEVSR